LARLGTPPAWDAILKIAQGTALTPPQAPAVAGPEDLLLRAYAISLLGEKREQASLPALLGLVESAPPELRGDVLQTLGFFDDPRASQVLFDKLHAPKTLDRVNAILGLRNRESKDVVPALLAMLNDPAAPVRQVAHFAMQRLTGQRFTLSAGAARAESVRVAARWRAWWRENGASFAPVRQPPCRDW
jgi:HEAT repeat protein